MVQGAWPFLVCATVVLLKGEEDRKLQEEHTLKKKKGWVWRWGTDKG